MVNKKANAQQLIINQSFENCFKNIEPFGFYGVWYSSYWQMYNQYNLNTHTYAFAYSMDTFSKNYVGVGIVCAKDDTFSNPVHYYLTPNGTRFLVLEKSKHRGFHPVPNNFLNALIGGIALETKNTLLPNNYYLCRFYSYCDTTGGTSIPMPPLSGLSVGVSMSNDSLGKGVGHVYPPLAKLFILPDNKYYWKKFNVLFESPMLANYITFMPDFDTTVTTRYTLDYCSLYPVKFSSTRLVNMCRGDSMKLRSLITGNNYEWNTGDSGLYITVKDTGYYQCYVYTSDTVIVDSIRVLFSDESYQKVNNNKLCKNDSLLLNPTTILINAKYLWNTGDTTERIIVHSTGKYWMKNSFNSCVYVDTIVVESDTLPQLQLPQTAILCKGSNLILNVQNDAYKNYLWNTGQTTSSLLIDSAGSYIIKVDNGFCSDTDSIKVIRGELPEMSLTNDTIFCFDDPQLKLIQVKSANVKYSWNDLSDTTSYILVSKPGKYFVQIIDSAGCKKIDSINITNECESKIWIPNVFTPNNDGINDDLRIHYVNIESVELKIYNRLSGEVFHTNSKYEYWDGTISNVPALSGVYFWELSYKNYKGNQNKVERGTLQLLR